jgi:hypothetical protein
VAGLVRVGLAVALFGAFLCLAGPASASRGVRGGLYAPGPDIYAPRAELRVSTGGRWFVPRRSRVEIEHSCGDLDLAVGRPGHPVRIGVDGRFRFRRPGPRAIRVWGRFVTRDRVKIRVRFRPLGDRLPLSCGASAWARLSLERVRRIPFRDCRAHPERAALDAAGGRVFDDLYYGVDGWEEVAWACLFSDNRRVVLARRPYVTDDAGFGPFRLVGSYAAFQQFECFALACPEWWTVVDARDGRKVRELSKDLPVGLDRIPDLELKENGSVAVIGRGYASPWNPVPWEVWAYDTQGPRRLDEGNIEPESLELVGSTLSWVKDGVTRSAVLD